MRLGSGGRKSWWFSEACVRQVTRILSLLMITAAYENVGFLLEGDAHAMRLWELQSCYILRLLYVRSVWYIPVHSN
jgi:hypothetical protein